MLVFQKFRARTKWMITILAEYGDLIANVRNFQYLFSIMCSIMIVIYGESMKVTLTKTGGIIVVAP